MCYCLNTCFTKSLKLFLEWYFPLIITCDSPYLEYIKQVYGSNVTCPFFTKDFRFIYNDKNFQSPKWPMAECSGNVNSRHFSIRAVGKPCNPHECEIFKQKNRQRDISNYNFEWYNGRPGFLMGVRWSEPYSNILPMLNNEWVEVVRSVEHGKLFETLFHAAIGSGVFINTGNTYVENKINDLSHIEDEWMVYNNIVPSGVRRIRRGSWIGNTHIPLDKLYIFNGVVKNSPYYYMGYDLGYDSIQTLNPPQITITSIDSTVNSSCCKDCNKHDLLLKCSHPTSLCGYISYRTGLNAISKCDCSNKYETTNCFGKYDIIGETQLIFDESSDDTEKEDLDIPKAEIVGIYDKKNNMRQVDINDDAISGRNDDARSGRNDDSRSGRNEDSRSGRNEDSRFGRYDDARSGRYDDARYGRNDDARYGRNDDSRFGRNDDSRRSYINEDSRFGRNDDPRRSYINDDSRFGRYEDSRFGRDEIQDVNSYFGKQS